MTTTSFESGLALERETFPDLREGDQARAQHHILLAQQEAQAPRHLKGLKPNLSHVAVVSGGTLGAGIAFAMLNAGLRVTILETDAASVERAVENIEKIISSHIERGLISKERATDLRNQFTASADYSKASDAELALEATVEDIDFKMDIKKAVFAKLQNHLPSGAVLATSTSHPDINEIADCLEDPSRVVGLHFFAPAHIMKLLEIIRGDRTSDAALTAGYALAKKLQKVPVLATVCDGFIGNRILARYHEAADTVLLEGATPWEIDEAMVEFGYAMGPYEAQDLSGLDIAHAHRRRQDATRDPDRRYILIADRMVELGKLGKKVGAGWYRYPGGGGKVEDPIVADLAIEEAYFAKIDRREFDPQEICDRLVSAMINEACDILHEGIATSASDIDLVSVLGCGFPQRRGGLMYYADTLGAGAVLNTLREFQKEDSLVWKPSPALLECVADGKTLSQYRRIRM